MPASTKMISSSALKQSEAEQFKPVRMALSGHQLFGTFAYALWQIAAQESAMIQKELEQSEVGRVQLFAQEEIIAQS